jgi:hypothetical protein
MTPMSTRIEFLKYVKKFQKDKGISEHDFKELIRDLDINYSSSTMSSINPAPPSEGDLKDFYDLHSKMVDSLCNFVKTHPDTQKAIEAEQKRLGEEWNKDIEDPRLHLTPLINFGLNTSGADQSIEQGHWVPSTDSCLSISVGDQDIIVNI